MLSKSETVNICQSIEFEEWIDMSTGELKADGTVGKSIVLLIRGGRLYIRGSLSQFYHENHNSLTWNEVGSAVQKLQQILGVDLHDAAITRLDIERTIQLQHPIQSYFDSFGPQKHYYRSVDKSSLYYSNSNRRICIYDKSKKIYKDLGQSVNPSSNLSRFEIRYNRGFIKQLCVRNSIDKLTVAELLNPSIQLNLETYWYDEIYGIPKFKKLIFSINQVTGLKELKEALMIRAINDLGGAQEVISMINRSTLLQANCDAKSISRIRVWLRKLGQMSSNEVVNPIQEMHDEIEQLMNNYKPKTRP